VAFALPLPGEGYGVDTTTLDSAASAAESLGSSLATLRTSIAAALATTQSVGLGVGDAISEVAPQWNALLDYLAGQVTATGSTLAANAVSYSELEEHLTSTILGIGV
jgi:hypothetical protein